MPRMKPDNVTEFLAQPHIGEFATLRRDGRRYTVPIWILHHDDAFWITGTYDRVGCKQLFHDPRASLCVEAAAPVAGHGGVDGAVTTTSFRTSTSGRSHVCWSTSTSPPSTVRRSRQHAHRAPAAVPPGARGVPSDRHAHVSAHARRSRLPVPSARHRGRDVGRPQAGRLVTDQIGGLRERRVATSPVTIPSTDSRCRSHNRSPSGGRWRRNRPGRPRRCSTARGGPSAGDGHVEHATWCLTPRCRVGWRPAGSSGRRRRRG